MKTIKFKDGSEQFIPEKGDEAYDRASAEQKKALNEAYKVNLARAKSMPAPQKEKK